MSNVTRFRKWRWWVKRYPGSFKAHLSRCRWISHQWQPQLLSRCSEQELCKRLHIFEYSSPCPWSKSPSQSHRCECLSYRCCHLSPRQLPPGFVQSMLGRHSLCGAPFLGSTGKLRSGWRGSGASGRCLIPLLQVMTEDNMNSKFLKALSLNFWPGFRGGLI